MDRQKQVQLWHSTDLRTCTWLYHQLVSLASCTGLHLVPACKLFDCTMFFGWRLFRLPHFESHDFNMLQAVMICTCYKSGSHMLCITKPARGARGWRDIDHNYAILVAIYVGWFSNLLLSYQQQSYCNMVALDVAKQTTQHYWRCSAHSQLGNE